MSLRIQALRQLQNSGHQNTKINNPGGQGLRYMSVWKKHLHSILQEFLNV